MSFSSKECIIYLRHNYSHVVQKVRKRVRIVEKKLLFEPIHDLSIFVSQYACVFCDFTPFKSK